MFAHGFTRPDSRSAARRDRHAGAPLSPSDRRSESSVVAGGRARARAMGAPLPRRAAVGDGARAPRRDRRSARHGLRADARLRHRRHVRFALAGADEIAVRIEEVYRGDSAARERTGVARRGAASHGRARRGAANAGRGRRRVGERAGRRAARRRHRRRGRATSTSSRRSRASPCAIAWTACSRSRARCRAPSGPALVSRIKILSGLDIADRLRPQDGRARVAINGVAVDLRVSTLPASHGEKVVIRVLDGRVAVLTLDGMGFHADELATHRAAAAVARRADPRHRAHRLRQDDDALRGAAPAQGARRQHRHGRGSDRVSAAGHRAGAGEREGGAHLRLGAALDHAAGSGRRAHRRDSRSRNGGDRDPGVAHRAPRAVDAAHERRAERGDAPDRHRRGELQDRDGGEGRARAAARAPHLRRVLAANRRPHAPSAAARAFAAVWRSSRC